MDIEKEFLTVAETARLLTVSISSIYGLMKKGLLPHHRLGVKTYRISRKDVETYLIATQEGNNA